MDLERQRKDMQEKSNLHHREMQTQAPKSHFIWKPEHTDLENWKNRNCGETSEENIVSQNQTTSRKTGGSALEPEEGLEATCSN